MHWLREIDETRKHQMTGAFVWFLILMWVLPKWYENPVSMEQLKIERSVTTVVGPAPSPMFIPAPEMSENSSAKASALEAYQREQEEKERLAHNGELVQQASPESDVKAGEQWIVRLVSYPEREKAQAFVKKAQARGFDLVIKGFQNDTVFSVRTVPFFSLAKAQAAKRELDKLFVLHDSNILKVDNE